MSESKLVAEVLIALGARADCRVWRSNSGVAKNRATGAFVRFGVPGQGDVSGILRGGRRLEIELKTPRGRQSEEQLAFQQMIERFGGLYVLARSVDDAVAAVEGALAR